LPPSIERLLVETEGTQQACGLTEIASDLYATAAPSTPAVLVEPPAQFSQ
jgi:hypothetical protein